MNNTLKIVLCIVLCIIIASLVIWGIVKLIQGYLHWSSQHPFISALCLPFIIAALIGGAIGAFSSSGDTDYYSGYDSTETEVRYDNQDIWGVSHGSTTVNSDKATHSNYWGIWDGSSEIKGNEIQHKTWYGEYNGVSKIKGNKIEHYGDIDEGYVYKGHSEIKDNGDIDHYDFWGVYTGTSKKK